MSNFDSHQSPLNPKSPITKENLCVLIPVFNESKNIASVIQRIKNEGYFVYVVDDGSTDHTAEVLSSLDIPHKILPKNMGKGAAIRAAFLWFLTQSLDACVVMDGDGQHHPDEIILFLNKLNLSEAEVLVGNRMWHPEKMPWIRIFTNKLMSWIISRMAGQTIPDTQCGFRALTKNAVEKIQFKSNRFEVESEMLLNAAALGLKIESVNIRSIYQQEKSSIHPLKDTLRFIRFLMNYRKKS